MKVIVETRKNPEDDYGFAAAVFCAKCKKFLTTCTDLDMVGCLFVAHECEED